MNDCISVWKEAENGDTRIYTSFFTFAEVFKAKCEGKLKPLSEANDIKIEILLRQSWIRPAVVDEKIGIMARRLMRTHNECKRPADAVHFSTAISLNVDEMHTFDTELLKLDGKVNRADGKPLRVFNPKPHQPNESNLSLDLEQ